jgi:hypothetical protein
MIGLEFFQAVVILAIALTIIFIIAVRQERSSKHKQQYN